MHLRDYLHTPTGYIHRQIHWTGNDSYCSLLHSAAESLISTIDLDLEEHGIDLDLQSQPSLGQGRPPCQK